MTPNPPIRGHALLFEGGQWRTWTSSQARGGCECGAKPDGFPNVGVNEMKRWHRQHKVELRDEVTS